jgi:putative transposase
MQRSQGEFAQAFNLKKKRSGAFWSDRYHATMIQDNSHLWECLRYIDLNMVRAGEVKHPKEWEWCGYNELIGKRKRYRMIDIDWWVDWSGSGNPRRFFQEYASWVDTGISQNRGMTRESWWTESIAVGTRDFVSQIETEYSDRINLNLEKADSGAWTIREPSTPYRT